MTIDFLPGNVLGTDVSYGFLDGSERAPRKFHPRVVVNDGDQSVLRVIRDELTRCREFLFSVAFVTPGAIALLKQELLDFAGRGTIVTSDYLSFNSPRAFEELLNLRELTGIEVRIHESNAFHPKGYIFTSDEAVTAMMGSANLTKTALSSNHEWNLKVSASPTSDLAEQLKQLADRERSSSAPLTREWVDEYAATWVAPPPRTRRAAIADTDPSTPPVGYITPNAMQERALAAIAAVRGQGERKAMIVSATGTGKTILSALDVRAFAPDRILFVVHREQILDRSIEEYQRVLGGNPSDYGKFTGSTKQQDRRYVFSTVQTLSRNLEKFAPDAFDYVVIDEAHRAGAEGHLGVLTHFTPKFLLGMTATPERTDGFNVFELFDFNVPYEIRLQHALEEDMLAPFHYYGIADVTYADGSSVRDDSELNVLVTPERARHVVSALEKYAQAGVRPRGLIFCSRNEEAARLSQVLNTMPFRGRTLRTLALSGKVSLEERERQVERLENGELDYILTVDIFNEGVDIPSVNQIVMLRQTQSSIVFVQQLGRGLRKDPSSDKEYLVVIDFIGNYKNNYMIPIALFGDASLNKETLRKEIIVSEERGVLPGLSSVRFDKIAQERVLQAIDTAKLDAKADLRATIIALSNRLGRWPRLWDFFETESSDPVVLATRDKKEHYDSLLQSTLKVDFEFTDAQNSALLWLSHEVLSAKRLHEVFLVKHLLENNTVAVDDLGHFFQERGLWFEAFATQGLLNVLSHDFVSSNEARKYGGPIIANEGGVLRAAPEFLGALSSHEQFRESVSDIIRTAEAYISREYGQTGTLVTGRQYSGKDACRLLGWNGDETSGIGGYRVRPEKNSCPIFITLHKGDDFAENVRYEDRLLDRTTIDWFSKNNRMTTGKYESQIIANTVPLHIFARKTKDAPYYYLGTAHAQNAHNDVRVTENGETLKVARMTLQINEPMPASLYDYFHPALTE